MKSILAALFFCACGSAVSPDPVPDARAADVLVQDEPDAGSPLNVCTYGGVAFTCTGPGFNVFAPDAGTSTCYDTPCQHGWGCGPIGASAIGFCE